MEECNGVVVKEGKHTADLLRDVIFLLFHIMYILRLIQLEVECNELNLRGVHMNINC